MTNDVKVFNNGKIDLPVKEVGGQVYFEAEASAIGLGIYYVGGEKTWHFNAELNRHLFTLVCER